MTRWPRLFLIGSVVASCVGCDQLSKGVASRVLVGTGPISLLHDSLRLGYAENPGAFLSLGADLSSELRFWLLGVAVTAVLVLLARQLIVDTTFGAAQLMGLALVVGGGIGNLVDRMRFGVVRDFLNVGWGPVRTGVFNLADLAITVGGVIALFAWRVRATSETRRAP